MNELVGIHQLHPQLPQRQMPQEASRESEEIYRLLFESNPQPMWVYDRETLEFLAVNEAAIRHYGYSSQEFLSMTLSDIRPAEDMPLVLASIEASSPGLISGQSWRHRKKDGKLINVEISSRELLFAGRRARLVLATDVTDRKVLEGELRQAQKMEAIGRLAGGIAHDFNNLLTAILGYSELLSKQVGADETLQGNVEEIKKAGERAAVLTSQLLAFSRKQVIQPKRLDLNEIIVNLQRMLGRVIGEDIDVVTATRPDLGRVMADPGQIEQIILNLAVNARDAMPAGGKLTIEVDNAELDESYTRTHPAVTAGDYVLLAVSDTGYGMDAETQSHIFEPFFTTKGGKGTGLGLSTVYGIVKQSGGYVWVYSETGRGTAFKIYLPRVDGAVESIRGETLGSEPLWGSETILLAEDDEGVRKLARTVLETYNYVVLEASSGAEARDVFERHSPEIDLVVTDVVMPQMSGVELAGRLRESSPDVKVLYMSGYAENAVVRHGLLNEGVAFLPKPFTALGFVRKVRQILDVRGEIMVQSRLAENKVD